MTTTKTAPPCASCETTGGYIRARGDTPRRISGKRFGIDGDICRNCYARHYAGQCKQAQAANRAAQPRGPRPTEFKADPLEHQGLVRAIALKYLGRGMDLDDLVGWGQIGLLNACLQFDPSLGAKFSTYATTCIKHTILRELADKVSIIHIPNYLAGHLWKQDAVLATEKKNDRLEEARAVLGRKVVSDHCLEEPMASLVYAREEEAEKRDEEINAAARRAAAILATLPEREAHVLRLRFGIGHHEHTLKEVGQVIGFSRETVRTIEHRAIERLQEQIGVAI